MGIACGGNRRESNEKMEKQKEKQLQSRKCKGRRPVHLTSTESNDAAWNKKLLNATLREKSFKFLEKITFTN